MYVKKKYEAAMDTQDSLETLVDRIQKGARGHKFVDDFISDTIAYLVYEGFNLDPESLDPFDLTITADGETGEIGTLVDSDGPKSYDDLLDLLGFDSEPDWGKMVEAFRARRFMSKVGISPEDLAALPDSYSGAYLS